MLVSLPWWLLQSLHQRRPPGWWGTICLWWGCSACFGPIPCIECSCPYLHGDLLHDLPKHRYEAHQSVDPCVLSPFCEIRENVSLFPVIRDFIWSPPIFKYKAEPLGNNISQFPQDAGVNLIRTHRLGAIVLHQAVSVQYYFRPFRHCLRLSKSVSQKSRGKRAATNDLNNLNFWELGFWCKRLSFCSIPLL